MRARYYFAALTVAALALTATRSVPTAAPVHSTGQDTTTLDDQVDLNVTVYNSDIALVRDVRNVQAAGRAASTCASWISPRRSIQPRCTSDR